MPVAVITGANRGIGLEFCRQLNELGYEVIALCRKKSKELASLPVRIIEGVENTKESSFPKIPKIDLLIVNAGIFKEDSLKKPQYNAILEQFEVNVLGSFKAVKAFLPHLKRGGKIAIISSRAGSIAHKHKTKNQPEEMYGYRISKAALNMLGVCLAHDLKPQKIALALLHPGYVKTRMTDFGGSITAEESVKGLLKNIKKLTLKNTGTFWKFDGEIVPW